MRFLGSHFPLEGPHETGFYVGRNFLDLCAFEHLESFTGGIDNHKAVGALIHVPLPMCLRLLGNRLIQVVVQLPEELFTGKQMRLPLSA